MDLGYVVQHLGRKQHQIVLFQMAILVVQVGVVLPQVLEVQGLFYKVILEVVEEMVAAMQVAAVVVVVVLMVVLDYRR